MRKPYGMKEPYDKDIKIEIMDKCFAYLVRKGLDKASIKNLCQETGISSGSIYYWFKDKDEVILETSEYGLNMIAERLYSYAYTHIQNIKEVINGFPYELMKYKNELRFIYQVTMSNQYGDKMRLAADKLNLIYDAFSIKLAEKLNCTYEQCQPFVYLFISTVLDYIVWDDQRKIEKELNAIFWIIRVISQTQPLHTSPRESGSIEGIC